MINNIVGQGTFRGVPFLIVEDVEQTGGHRIVQHDYPLRDVGRVQNMGRKAESTTINIILIGDDVLAQRDALVTALNLSEAGELEHPNFETQLIQVIEWRQRISTRAQRVVSFTITYVAADIDDDSPVSTTNGAIDLQSAIDLLTDGLISDFKHYYDKLAIATSRTAETLDFATRLANNITNAIRGITDATGLSTLLSSSLALKASMNNLIDSPDKVMREVGDLLGAIKSVKGSNASNVYTAINVANNLVSSPNSHAVAFKTAVDTLSLANQSAVILSDATRIIKTQHSNIAQINNNSVSLPNIITRSDCEKLTLSQGKALQAVRVKASDRYWYDTAKNVREVRKIFGEQMQLISIKLPSAASIISSTTTPALVLLYRETGSSLQIKRFTRRNAIMHPTFAVGGKDYEVINETNH